MSRTLVIIKPDAMERGLQFEITEAFRDSNFEITGLVIKVMTHEEAEELYTEHRGKSHFNDLVDYTTSGPVAIMCMERFDAARTARVLIGATNPADRLPGTLRAKYAIDYRRNSVHGSDSDAAAEREIKIFFK